MEGRGRQEQQRMWDHVVENSKGGEAAGGHEGAGGVCMQPLYIGI